MAYKEIVPGFRILGPLEVLADDGTQLALGGQKQRALLVLLLLRVNHVVSTDFIVEALWGENPPRTAITSLQNSISALRKLLGPEVLETKPPGYRLVVEPERIDLGRFERLVRESHGLEPAHRSDRLREALTLWRGDPLADVTFEPFASAEVSRLQELYLAALEDRIDADLACERHAELVPELVGLVAQHPLRERLVGQLMLAHYQSGRQEDALRVYQGARGALDELGLEPSPQLQSLQTRILRHELPLPQTTEATAGGTHFEEVAEAMLAGRLVPVLGTDVGALAAELARRFDYSEDGRDLTRVAQFVALTKGPGRLYDELRSLLASSAAPTPVHRFFASLPSLLRDRGLAHQLLVTASYDLALEQALLDAGEEFDVVSYLATGHDRGRFCHRDPSGAIRVIDLPNTYVTELSLDRRTIVLKLHGGLGQGQDGFVVTEDDYIRYLAHGDVANAVPVALAAKLRRSHFLFLGYRMREWSLRLVFDRISAGEPLAYRSWAVLPEPEPLDGQFWRARDVDLLVQPLDEYVEALGRTLGAESVKAPT